MIANIDKDNQSHVLDVNICPSCGHVKFTLGDVDCNGVINLHDLVTLAQLAAGWDNVKHADTDAGDVNCDGLITEDDVDLLAKYLAGWDVQLGQ